MTSVQLLTMGVGTVLPVLVGLVTKASWGGGTRAVVLLVLAALAGVGQAALAAPSLAVFDWGTALFDAWNTLVVAVAMHFGFWSPTGVADWAKGALVKDASA